MNITNSCSGRISPSAGRWQSAFVLHSSVECMFDNSFVDDTPQPIQLLQAKERELKATLNNEFRLIHEICVFVLCNTRKPDLIRSTLDTLSVYLTWVPLGYIFESNLLEILLQLFPQPAFRNVALQVG